MNLLEIQDDFQRTVLEKESAGADWVTKTEHGITPEHRIAIYHNAYRVRLMDVLWIPLNIPPPTLAIIGFAS